MHVRTTLPTDQVKSDKGHFKCFFWSLNLKLWFKWNSTNMVPICISSNHIILPCHIHASYCCIALIVSFLVCRYLSPLSRRGFDDVIDDIVGTRLLGGDKHRQRKKKHNQCNATMWCMNVTWQYAMVGANATKTRLNDVGLNPGFKFKLHMWLFKCHLIELS